MHYFETSASSGENVVEAMNFLFEKAALHCKTRARVCVCVCVVGTCICNCIHTFSKEAICAI